MESQDETLIQAKNGSRGNFHHPYTPYDVQLQFMNAAYDVLSQGEGQVGILESPTGTGKSLSLICASLTWLRNHKRAQYEASVNVAAEDFTDEPAWMIEQVLQRKRDELMRKWEEREQRLEAIRAKEQRQNQRGNKRRRLDNAKTSREDIDEEAEFLLADRDAAQEHDNDPLSSLSKETRDLMAKVGLAGARKKPEEEDTVEEELKIYYTSRTHSQLSQFISELRRPQFSTSLPQSARKDGEVEPTESVKQLPLSSRQKLCINPAVSRLGSLSAINDRCSELQQPKSKAKCPFVPNAENTTQTHEFRDSAMATLPDIEDLHQLGKSLRICPYYASRAAVPAAEVITLPYPLLLQKSARDAWGIKLEGNVVIIDEAHNIMDAVANVHAAEISLSQLRKARQILAVYAKRFGKKLKGENRAMVGQVGRVIEALSEWLDGASGSKTEHGIVDPTLLLKHKGADQINMFDLIKYIHESKLAFKVESYAIHIQDQDAATTPAKSTGPVLHTLASFLLALTNLSTEGRIFFEKTTSPSPDIKLSYLLLSPTHAFFSIASSARAVILAGGTMSPFEDYKAHLFPAHPTNKITTLSCGHVIPPSNLCVWTLASSRPAQGTAPDIFEFSFQKRSDKVMVRQLGMALLNMCAVVPDGVVVFFPSYGYLDEVVNVWSAKDKDNPRSIWDRLQDRKALFREAKGGSSDDILQEYSNAILDGDDTSKQRGALLLSVVGGKMSEGINFSDRLGRCVVIVGLPYPNINSPEWKARIEYIESVMVSRLTNPSDPSTPALAREEAVVASKAAARDFYENACMRAVNQSIGRAIRHKDDYAAIVLVDRRFGTDRIKGKLPGWIRGGMVQGSEEKGLPGLMGALGGFFRGKQTG